MPTTAIDEALAERVGERLQELRIARGVSQEDLAQRAGVHRTYPSLIERGVRNCTVAALARLCAGLDLTLEEFFHGFNEEELGHSVGDPCEG